MTMQSSRPIAKLSVAEFLRCHLIHRDPLVILSYGLPLSAPIQLSPFLADRRVYFLNGNWWSLCDPKELARIKGYYAQLSNWYPKHRFLFLTNAPQEEQALEAAGLPHFFCHHNTFLDEGIFRPLPRVKKTLDAVYTARLHPFKRQILARRIPSWGLLYYGDQTRAESQPAYLDYLRRAMPGMVCLNHDPATDTYHRLTPQEMCLAYNRARVGLCLSRVEGGNYATTEYQLCGLPVVSTPSEGGRDVFLDPETSRIVEPDTRAVAAAVAELAARRFLPGEVRLRALARLREHRLRFISLVESILPGRAAPNPSPTASRPFSSTRCLPTRARRKSFWPPTACCPVPRPGRPARLVDKTGSRG